MKAINTVLIFDNFNVAVIDESGAQITRLQQNILTAWAAHVESCGYNPDGLVVLTQTGQKWRLFRCDDGGWNLESVTA